MGSLAHKPGTGQPLHSLTLTSRLEAHFRGLAERFALCKLAPYSKRPVERGWTSKPQASPDEVVQWLREGYGIGLRLGEPSQNLIALDVDGMSGINWLWQSGRGHPTDKCRPDGVAFDVPTIRSQRGSKYLIRLPDGMSLSKIKPSDADIELLGDGHQLVLPSPYAPDSREWIKVWSDLWAPELVALTEMGSDQPTAVLDYTSRVMPEAAQWLKRYIQGQQKAPKRKKQKRATQRQHRSAQGPPQGDTLKCAAARWLMGRSIAIGHRNAATTALAILATHAVTEAEAERILLDWHRRGGTERGPGGDGEPFTEADVRATVASTYRHHREHAAQGIDPHLLTTIHDTSGQKMPWSVATTVFNVLPKVATDRQPRPIEQLKQRPVEWHLCKLLTGMIQDASGPVVRTTAQQTAARHGLSLKATKNVLWPVLKRAGLAETVTTRQGRETDVHLHHLTPGAAATLLESVRPPRDRHHLRNKWRWLWRRLQEVMARLWQVLRSWMAWLRSWTPSVPVVDVPGPGSVTMPVRVRCRDPDGLRGRELALDGGTA